MLWNLLPRLERDCERERYGRKLRLMRSASRVCDEDGDENPASQIEAFPSTYEGLKYESEEAKAQACHYTITSCIMPIMYKYPRSTYQKARATLTANGHPGPAAPPT